MTYIRWGKKNCPNTGATLVYEGNNKIVSILSHRMFYLYDWRGGIYIYAKYKFQLLVDQNINFIFSSTFERACLHVCAFVCQYDNLKISNILIVRQLTIPLIKFS